VNELVQLLLSVQPATLTIMAVAGYALERRIRRIENRTLRMETKLDLLLSWRNGVDCASDPKTDVGPALGPPRP